MAERVVDILETVEVDREHRRRAAGAAHVGDELGEALAEVSTVRQARQRIVQRKVAQLILTSRNRGRGMAHVAKDEHGKDDEADEGDAEERNDVAYDLGARTLRRPSEPGD